MTLVVNLFAGPGVGKSTAASYLFYSLKKKGYSVELVTEYAKDLTWDERYNTLGYQPYVAANQMYRVHRLLGKVDIIITDSPIMFCGWIYEYKNTTDTFRSFVLEQFRAWDTFNLHLLREGVYIETGRNQTVWEAYEIDKQVQAMLNEQEISYVPVAALDHDIMLAALENELERW